MARPMRLTNQELEAIHNASTDELLSLLATMHEMCDEYRQAIRQVLVGRRVFRPY